MSKYIDIQYENCGDDPLAIEDLIHNAGCTTDSFYVISQIVDYYDGGSN